MKNKFIKTNCLAVLAYFSYISIIGCKKEWLNEKTDITLAVPATLKDCQALLDNTSVFNARSCTIGEVASDGYTVNESSYLNMADNERNAYTWSKTFSNTTTIAQWASIYTRIYYCNLVLETLEKIRSEISSSDTSQWTDIKGQALFSRAWNYYELSQIYIPHYSLNNAGTDLGLPLRIEPDVNLPTTRSTVQQTYNLIVNDLLMAKDLVGSKALYKTRGSKPAAYGLLARIYLVKEEYNNAELYVDSAIIYAIQNNDTLMHYKDISNNNNPFQRLNSETIYYNAMGASSTFSTQSIIDTSLFNSYVADDLRKTLFFRMVSGNILFKGNYTNSATSPFSGLAIDEIFLIKAEVSARLGNKTTALYYLNTLLRKRWKPGTFVDVTTTDAEEALRRILQERRKELFRRGLRWTDLRRLNTDNRFKITLSRTIAGQVYVLDPNSYKYTFPIPDNIIQLSGIGQNPGWQ